MRAILEDIAAVVLGLSIAGYACTTAPSRKVKLPLPEPPKVVLVVAVCGWDELPTVPHVGWPAPDKLGNVLLHTSTAEATREKIYILEKYISQQWGACQEAKTKALKERGL